MKNVFLRKQKDTGIEGMIMLEALIVYMVTIFLLFFILALFCVFYHIWNMQTIANEAAMRIAQTCKFEEADVDTGYVTLEQLTSLDRYRYLPAKKNKMEQIAKEKLQNYVDKRLDKVSFVHKMTDPEIRMEIKKDGLASRHVEVNISEEFQVPFGTALSYFGYEDTITYECTGYADYMDIIDYVNMVDYVSQERLLNELAGSTIKLINSVLKLFKNIFG